MKLALPGWLLNVAILALLLANALLYANQQALAQARSGAAWQQWAALAPAEQTDLTELYRHVLRDPDAAAVLRRARRFAAAPARQQAAQRLLFAAVQDELTRATPARRRDLLRAAPAARAYLIYDALRSERPDVARALVAPARAAKP
jgi:hypothetical protein